MAQAYLSASQAQGQPAILDTQSLRRIQEEAGRSQAATGYSSGPSWQEMNRVLQNSTSGSSYPTNNRAAQHSSSVSYEPHIEGTIDNRPISALADSGAGANYISQSTVRSFGLIVDTSQVGIVRTANGQPVRTLGKANANFSFNGERQIHRLEFNVVPWSVRDVILGSPFLRLTECFTRFAHRIVRKACSALSSQVRYIGAPQQLVRGYFQGIPVSAACDTGSDVNLISRDFAERHRILFDTDPTSQVRLEFFDGSMAMTCGVLKEAIWQYGSNSGPRYSARFYVVDSLKQIILLGYSFLHSTDSFTRYGRYIQDVSESEICHQDWVLGPIKIKKKPGSDRSDKVGASAAGPNLFDAWEREQQSLLQTREQMEESLNALPQAQRQQQREASLARWNAQWTALMQRQPPSSTNPPRDPQQAGQAPPWQNQTQRPSRVSAAQTSRVTVPDPSYSGNSWSTNASTHTSTNTSADPRRQPQQSQPQAGSAANRFWSSTSTFPSLSSSDGSSSRNLNATPYSYANTSGDARRQP